jgi:hypothetical protein
MADFVFNIAKGRVAELYNRVDSGDPTDSRLVVVVLNVTGGVAAEDAALIDADTLAAIEALSNVAEVTNTGYARKYITSSDISAISPDDTNNRMDLDIADQTWTAVSAGDAWMKLVVCYIPDGNASGGLSADSAVVPLTAHDFAVTPDGSDITAQIAAAGFFRAA